MKTVCFALFLIFILDIEAISRDHERRMFPNCGGFSQSPINIITSHADYNGKLQQFEFSDSYDDPFEGAIIENTGYTIQIRPGANDQPRRIDEGGLDAVYQFELLKFFWGSNSKKGSEHRIDGEGLPLEVQLIHRNTDYKNMVTAMYEEDGLAILSVLFKLDDADNPALEPIIDKLDDVRKQGSSPELHNFELSSLLPEELMPYYRYQGSLTNPPCNEAVTWTVFKDYVTISEKQLQQFRTIKTEEAGQNEEFLFNNYRPVQPLHGRVVYLSGEEDHSTGSIAAPTAILVLSLAAFIL